VIQTVARGESRDAEDGKVEMEHDNDDAPARQQTSYCKDTF